MMHFTAVIFRCYLVALAILFGHPLSSVRGRHSLYAGLEAHRGPAIALFDGSPLAVPKIVAPPVFESGSFAAGNFTATVLSKPVAVVHCTAPPSPSPATRTTAVVLVAGSPAGLSDPSATVGNDRGPWNGYDVPILAAVPVVFVALFVAATLFFVRIPLFGLERKRAALQTKIDDRARDASRRTAAIAAIQARYTSEHASLVRLERSVANLVADLEVVKISLVHTEASRNLADERSIGLREFLDALLGREQLAEQSHVKDVAWFDERYNTLDSQRAVIQVQQPAEQETTELENLEQTLKRRTTKLRLSELHELGQLTTIANLEQDIEQARADGNALLQENIDLQQTCVAIQDDALTLRVNHEHKVDKFNVKIDDLQLAIAGSSERADAAAQCSNALQAEIDEARETASHLRTRDTGALKVAYERINELNADIVATDTKTSKLEQTSILLKVELPALGEDADAFEALAAKVEAENDAIESQLAQDDAEDDLWRGVLTAERDDLLNEQADTDKESQDLSKDIKDTQLSTAGAVSAIQALQGEDGQHHLQRTTSLEQQFASNTTITDALTTRYKTLKGLLSAREAQYSARLDEFTKAEEQCAQDVEDTMFLTREAVFDTQQYESLGIEATRKQREAADDADSAVERASKAQAQSIATEKEMRISRFAFSTQVKDVEAQCASLSKIAEELEADGRALGDANSQLQTEINRQIDEFERKAGSLRSRLVDAEAGLYIFDTVHDDTLQRMDAHLNVMQVHREMLQGNIQDYGSMIDTADEAIAEIVREREEEQDAQSAAEGQAEALNLLLFSPGSHSPATPNLSFSSSSATSSPTSPAEILGTPKDYELIFDCSSEELDVEAGILVESETVKALAPSNIGLGILL